MEELLLGDIFEEIAERLALARTRALMGEREQALGLLQSASLEFTRFRSVLTGYPGFLALEHDLETTLSMLCAAREGSGRQPGEVKETARAGKTRRRSERAA